MSDVTAASGFLSALAAVQAEAPTLPKDKTNPQEYSPEQRRGWRDAQRLYRLGDCEYDGCSRAAADRHHVDGDTTNNAPSNVALYCRRHHMLIDGRLDALAARAHRAAQTAGRKVDTEGRERAERFLLELLADGPVAFNDVRRITIAHGLTWNSIMAAKKRLGVRSRRRVTATTNDWAWETS